MTSDELFFFNSMPDALPLYASLSEKLLAAFPNVAVEVKKTQIAFREKHGGDRRSADGLAEGSP